MKSVHRNYPNATFFKSRTVFLLIKPKRKGRVRTVKKRKNLNVTDNFKSAFNSANGTIAAIKKAINRYANILPRLYSIGKYIWETK